MHWHVCVLIREWGRSSGERKLKEFPSIEPVVRISMTMRPIVRDPNILSGRWRIDGTEIAIAAIRQIYAHGMDDIKRQYRSAHLTDEEIQAALAFEFPAVREPDVEIHLSSLTVHCECGEDTPQAAGAGNQMQMITCVCGRRWRVSLHVERDRGQSSCDGSTGAIDAT